VFQLEIVGLNRATYDVGRSEVVLRIHPKEGESKQLEMHPYENVRIFKWNAIHLDF